MEGLTAHARAVEIRMEEQMRNALIERDTRRPRPSLGWTVPQTGVSTGIGFFDHILTLMVPTADAAYDRMPGT